MLKKAEPRFTETAKEEKTRLKEAAKKEAERKKATAKHELGRAVLDVTDEYFPEEVRDRRRRDMARGFLAGAAIGLLLRSLIRE